MKVQTNLNGAQNFQNYFLITLQAKYRLWLPKPLNNFCLILLNYTLEKNKEDR